MPYQFNKGVKGDDSNSVTAPSSYVDNSRPTVTLSELTTVDSEADVNVSVTGGFEGEASSVNGNVVSVQINNVADPATTSGDESALSEVDSGEDLSSETIRVNGRGF